MNNQDILTELLSANGTPATFINCKTCNNPVAHLIHTENTTRDSLLSAAETLDVSLKSSELPVWIIAKPLEIRANDAITFAMKVLPNAEIPRKIYASDFQKMLEDLSNTHCG